MDDIEVLIIGGGPGGTTAATMLAKQGVKVLLVEKVPFPRFHIGESLLPASTSIFKELGVLDRVKADFQFKTGGVWLYDDVPLSSNFSDCRKSASFSNDPSAFLVERARLDTVLLDNARTHGVEVKIPCEVTDVVFGEDEQIQSVTIEEGGVVRTIRPHFVFDCSGYMSVIPRRLNLKDHNHLKRMATFSHFECEYVDKDWTTWFVGQMVYDGWMWLIPLNDKSVSIGFVTSVKRFEEASLDKEKFFEREVMRSAFVKKNFVSLKQQGEIHLYGNLGYSSKKVYGPNWVLVGDTAFFIDPCFSSGVHLALKSGMGAATTYLKAQKAPKNVKKYFDQYEKTLRKHEKFVGMFVDTFYFSSKCKFLRWFIPKTYRGFIYKDFVSISGGDYENMLDMYLTYYFHRFMHFLLPDKKPAWDT